MRITFCAMLLLLHLGKQVLTEEFDHDSGVDETSGHNIFERPVELIAVMSNRSVTWNARGKGKGIGRINGKGKGMVNGNGKGKGMVNGNGKGKGMGNGNGKGKGMGNGNGMGKGMGNGNGKGKGMGNGNGKGKGMGSWNGKGKGMGNWNGKGKGMGNGNGKGKGMGSWNGKGKGMGNWNGSMATRGKGKPEPPKEESEVPELPTIPDALSFNIDPNRLDDGGVNIAHTFTLVARNIPAGINSVRFDWVPGAGPVGTEDVQVINGEARTEIQLVYSSPGSYNLTATVSNGTEELATATAPITIAGTLLSITPPGLSNGRRGTSYSFDFEATGIPSSVTEVLFTWAFGDGTAGSASATVVNGRARTNTNKSYSADGVYGLVVDVKNGEAVLAQRAVTVIIGQDRSRTYSLGACGVWRQVEQSSQGVTIDNWTIAAVPVGAVFDFLFDAAGIPDKFIIEYPVGNVVHDTGWRGSQSRFNDNPRLYPGGLAGIGQGQVDNIFIRLTENSFRVTVIGPDPNTVWRYSVQCRIP